VTSDTLADEFARLRVLIVHEWFVSWAGSERVVEQLAAMLPHADLAVAVVSEEMRRTNPLAARARETWVSRLPGARTHHRWFLPVHPAAFASLDTRGYDLVVSSSHAFAKAVRVPEGVPHVCYCHSPPRYLYDLRETYAEQASPVERLALGVATPALRAVDRRAAARVSRFVANSAYVADRVRRWYGRESDVVHPPVDVKPGRGAGGGGRAREGFLLSLGRLVPYKRTDLAIAAAERLGVPLVVAGDGPERARLERMAGARTTFVGEVSEAEAGSLLDRCAALVFCAEEDFGITPVEANAHGAPVVGYGRGGLLESMVPGETAELFDEPTGEAVAAAVQRALGRRWDDEVLRANAARFSPARFRERMRALLRAAMAGSGDVSAGARVGRSTIVR
jgi:glycosyltransferase involved in cell wall biosynthesis